MLKKIMIIIGALLIVFFIGDTNLKGKSVYYAKHSSSSNTRDLEIMMLVENIQASANREGFRYRVDGDKTIKNTTKNVYLSYGYSVNDANYEYAYMYEDGLDYYFDNFLKLKGIYNSKEARYYIDISTVDENKRRNI